MNPFLHATRLALVGSASFWDLGRVRDYIARLHPGCTLITGTSSAVEIEAARAAWQRGLSVHVIAPARPATSSPDGSSNQRQIVEASDALVAFWDGTQDNTRRALDLARELRRPSELVLTPAEHRLTLELRR